MQQQEPNEPPSPPSPASRERDRGRGRFDLRRRWKAITAASVIAVAAFAFWRALPNPLFSAPVSSTLYDRDGHLLGARIATDGQWRFPALAQVPEKFAIAVEQFEDRRFRRHVGVDVIAIARAARANWRNGRVVSGGSTLTMQTIRLSRGDAPRTVGEKAIEALLALRLELGASKDEVLALYASNAPFGGNVVGLEAAAWRYFGRRPENLSWAEAATLAVLPNAPALIHPGRGRAQLQAKRDRLLARLHDIHRLDDLAYDLALREPLPDAPQALPRFAPHLLDTLVAEGDSPSAVAGRYDSTLDGDLQKRVDGLLEARAEVLAGAGVHNAAAIVIDNASMQVVAYAGNRLDGGSDGSSDERGLAIDLIRRPRSTGSVLKPFLFAAMLQDGLLQPSTLVPDVPTQFSGFRPENFDRNYRGAVRAREALAQSLNIPAVWMLRQYGLARFYDLLQRLGMRSLVRAPDDYGLTLIIGGAESSLWDLSRMYANLARVALDGDRQGHAQWPPLQVLRDARPGEAQAADYGAGAAWLTLDALQEVSRPELDQHWKNFDSARRLAWKTGTSQGQRDGWAIGVTPKHTVAVWVGNATGEGVAGLTGASMAAPLLFDIVNGFGDEGWFPMPRRDLRSVQVCRDDGYLPAAGCVTEAQWLPAEAHFEKVSRYQQTVHLDPAGLWRVDGRCQPVTEMQHASWFVLPPAQEHWYRLHDTGYRSLPPVRPDCRAFVEADLDAAQRPFELLYPEPNAAIYIPTDLGARRGKVVFEAAHRDPQAVLYWHVDEAFVARTTHVHKLALDLPPGPHRLTLVDGDGTRLVRGFSVLGGDAGGDAADGSAISETAAAE